MEDRRDYLNYCETDGFESWHLAIVKWVNTAHCTCETSLVRS